MLRRATAPVVEFLRSIPPPALIPFAIVVIGIGDDMKVFIIAFVCLWPVLLNTIDGINGIDPTLKDTARVYGISGRDRLMRITLPAASPQIFAGMRLSLSLALILMVISEMVAPARTGSASSCCSRSGRSRSRRCGRGSCCWASWGTCSTWPS